MKGKKRIIGLVSLVMTCCMLFSACSGGKAQGNGGKNTDGMDTRLDIYCDEAGYGVEWCEAMAEEFIKTDWVKEKYGKVTYNFIYSNPEAGVVASYLPTGSAVNEYDVMFSTGRQTAIEDKKVGGKFVLEDLTSLYESEIPGADGVKYKDRIYQSYYNNALVTLDGELVPRNAYWASGLTGILYNETLLNKLGFDAAQILTTDQLLQVFKDVKALNGSNKAYPYSYSILTSKAYYWLDVVPVFWAQYQGEEDFFNYFNLMSEDVISKDIFKQQGRLKALEVTEDFLWGSNGYVDDKKGTYEFKDAQSNFIGGKGLFCAEGDWFEYETSGFAEQAKQDGYDYTFKILKTPVISSIIDKTPTITSDEALQKVIADIDADKLYEERSSENQAVSEADYNRIAEARNIVYSLGMNHVAYVPSYASAKEVAKDFLLFMATDKGLEIYAEYTNGGSLPFEYDMEKEAPEVYKNISPLQKSRLEIINTNAFGEVTTIPDFNSFPAVYKGGLSIFASLPISFENAYAREVMRAQEIFDADIAYWTDEKFNDVVNKSGF